MSESVNDTIFISGLLVHAHHGVMAHEERVGQRFVNVGPGTNESLATTDSVFGPSEAPGIQVQSNFLVAGCSATLDTRDFPEAPHKGTYAEARYYRYYAEGHPEFSWQKPLLRDMKAGPWTVFAAGQKQAQ